MIKGPFIGALAAMAALISTNAFAGSPPIQFQPSPDSPIGVRNPSAPEELQQLEFLIGDWNVDVVLHRPNGDISYMARWHRRVLREDPAARAADLARAGASVPAHAREHDRERAGPVLLRDAPEEEVRRGPAGVDGRRAVGGCCRH